MRIMETEVGKMKYLFYRLGQFGKKDGNFLRKFGWKMMRSRSIGTFFMVS
jgi:hypothetical protein